MRTELKNEPWLNPFLHEVSGLAFFDVGANTGEFTEWAAKRFSHVVAFEPDPRAYHSLEAQAACNVDVRPQAVAAEPGKGRLGVSTQSLQSMLLEDDRTAHPFGHGSFDHSVDVDVVALRDVTVVPDWVKIDVEGGEPSVIRGMRNAYPNLIVECHGNQAEVVAACREKGYFTEGRKAISVGHPIQGADAGHCWLIVEGLIGFPANLKEATND